ncbi:hypothetical protein ASA1KI_34660 [Opitutales bacterium ASA1]|nr:hypothetical protein ASA1KI_34660 [Opitutales bacterium ASA1]
MGALRGHAVFTDVAAAAGLTITPPATVETNPPPGIDPYATGAPVCAADLDRDGWTDLVLSPTPGRLRVFMNNRDGTFREEGVERGFGEMFDIAGIAAGDFSNSGRTDVFLVPRTGPRYFLFVNDGTGHFTEQAVARGADMTVAGETHKGQSVGLVDYDRDGWLDIHVTEWGVFGTSDGDKYAVLLRNRGAEAPGHFVNVTQASGLRQPHFGISARGYASGWADFDDDGRTDLMLVSDFGSSQMWWNNGDGTFTEGRQAAGVGTDQNGMGLALADLDRDGRLDLFVSSFDIQSGGVLVSGNRLYRNLGDRRFEDVTRTWGVIESGWAWGAVFFDPNNDGHLDLLVTNGYSYTAPPSQPRPPYHIADARSDRTRFFLNRGTPPMSEVGVGWGVTDTGLGHGVAVLDFDNDGDEDVIVANLYGPWILYRNDAAQQGSWLRIRFTGTASNRDGYGTLVRATTGGVTQTALYAPTNAMIGQREPVLHFGLGTATNVDRLVVEWPSGARQEWTDVAVDQVLTFVEPDVADATAPVFTLEPLGGTYERDAEVVLRVAASGVPAPIFTWYRNGTQIPGAAGGELRIRRIHPLDAGLYTVVAVNAAGRTESATVAIDVTADMARHTVARWWNEALLDAIRRDTPNPPVHARNLYHLSAALWDVFWAYEPDGWSRASPVFHREAPSATDIGPDRRRARETAMSHAAYRLLSARFVASPGADHSLAGFDWLMQRLGCDPDFLDTSGNSPAAVGNRIGEAVLAATIDDGANETGGYADATGYWSVNEPLVVGLAGAAMNDPDRWQPLSLAFSMTQNGIVLPAGPQQFVGSNAIRTTPFALLRLPDGGIDLDPGAPPSLRSGDWERVSEEILDVIRCSALLDPADGVEIDVAPGAAPDHPFGPATVRTYPKNEYTGAPYAPNRVLRGDYARVLAEFWADGPHSETPPGHWNVIFNQVSDHENASFRWQGIGTPLARLEWEVRGYLALNGAMHDAACAAWTVKRTYDGPRPISLVRYFGGLGQSSDPALPRWHRHGLPLVAGLVELTSAESIAPGGRHAELALRRGGVEGLVDRVAIRGWRGNPADPRNVVGGVGWVLAEEWVPYQLDSFVTPAFPGYVSGHSTFSRTAAEVLSLATGTPFFPGGLATYSFSKDSYLTFEKGPSRDIELQWATYYDAADQAGVSRLYGGIHVSADDVTGRRMGSRVGLDAFVRAHALGTGPGGARSRLVNVSTRGVSGAGERTLIVGFVADGDAQDVLVRSAGSTLERYGVPADECAPDPEFTLFQGQGSSLPVLTNDDWGDSASVDDVLALAEERGAFAFDAGSREAAGVLRAGAGSYTAVATSGADDGRKVQLVEAYGEDLINVSTRGYVGQGAAVLIAGFSLVGDQPALVLVRGAGPALSEAGVQEPLADPVLAVYRQRGDSESEWVAGNDDWSDDPRASLAAAAAAASGAFSFVEGSRDAALFLQLAPGQYTVVLSGKAGADGVGLVEAYLIR